MKKMPRAAHLFLFILYLTTSPLLTGCTKRDPEGDESLKIMFINPWVGHEFWNVVVDGVRDAAEELSINLTIVGPPEGYSEANLMLSQFETAIAQKYDGVICHPFIPDTFTTVINKAVDAGLRVVCVADDAPQSKRTAAILTDDVNAGRAAGRAMLEALGGKPAVVALLSGLPGLPSLDNRMKGFREVVEKDPGNKIVSVAYSGADVTQNISKTQAQFITHPEINALFGCGAEHALFQAKVIKEMGTVGEVVIVGFDDLKEMLDCIQEDVVSATVVQRQYMWGYLSVHYLKKLCEGEAVPEVTDSGYVVVTKENIEEYKNKRRGTIPTQTSGNLDGKEL